MTTTNTNVMSMTAQRNLGTTSSSLARQGVLSLLR